MRFLSSTLSLLLTPLIALPLYGQLPSPNPAAPAPIPASLELRVIAAETAASSPTGSHSQQGISVEVRDQSGAAVANAAVIFRLPDTGPSGTFADGTHAAIVYSDASGRARTGAVHWGDAPGIVSLRITAAQGAAHAGFVFEETLGGSAPAPVMLPASRPASPAPAVSQAPPLTPGNLPAARPAPAVSQAPPLTPGNLPAARPAPGVVIENVSGKSAHKRPKPVAKPQDEDTDDTDPGDVVPAKTAALNYDSPDANVPIRHELGTGADEGDSPGVSVTSAGGDVHSGHSKKKWIFIVAAAAGAGVAFAMLHKGSAPSASSGLTIGSPSISIGHP